MTKPETFVRRERPEDVDGIRAVNQEAFGRPEESRLVDTLRAVPGAISVVAERDSVVVGHIQFSPAILESRQEIFPLAALGPMGVLPRVQRQGIGSALVREGLAACLDAGWRAVIVLGHPEYYPRFGFVPAEEFGIRSEFSVPSEVFMALELRPEALRGRGGLARYHPAFARV